MEGSEFIHLTNGSGSGRPINLRIRTTDFFFTSSAVQVKVERDLLVVVTTGGRLYLWDLSGGHQPKALLKNEEICPLNR
jgi:hypothetical protein